MLVHRSRIEFNVVLGLFLLGCQFFTPKRKN